MSVAERPSLTCDDSYWMREALDQARHAGGLGEVPIGAVWVGRGCGEAVGHNRTLSDSDPCAHAELIALRRAAQLLGNHRLGGVLYVTLEPCVMCMGALIQARVERLVYGADDAKAGAATSLYRLGEDARLNHRFPVTAGVEREEAAALLREFFQARRRS